MLRKGDEPIPGYRLDRFLGRGQFGEVWKTSAPGGTAAALKFIDLSGKQGIKEFRGVQRVKEIRHAHLMPITALWLLDDQGCVMDDKILATYDPEGPGSRATMQAGREAETSTPQWLVVGMLLGDKNLQDQLEFYQEAGATGIPPQELLRYIEETAKGIDFLNTPQHDLGEGLVSIQHCDIKPANIMLVGDSILICDFGLARMLGDVAATATGMVGSPAYMAPECIRRKPSTATDQYALAITYYELRTGSLPFMDQSYMAVLDSHSQGTLDYSLVSPEEQEILRVATALRPADRYPSAVEFVQALRNCLEGQKPVKRNRLVLPLGALVVVFAAIAIYGFFFGNGIAQEFKLCFEPADAQVTLNGELRALEEGGTVTVKILGGETVDVVASSPPFYLDFVKRFDLESLKKQSSPIRLSRSPAYFIQEAAQSIQAGDLDQAVQSYKQALELGGSHLPTIILISLDSEVAGSNCLVLAQAPVRSLLAAGLRNKSVRLWDWPTPEPKQFTPLTGITEPIESLLATANGRWLITVSFGEIRFYPLENLAADTPPEIRRGHNDDIITATTTDDSNWAVTGGADYQVLLWDLRGPAPSVDPLVLAKHQEQVNVAAADPDSQNLVTISLDGEIYVWSLKNAGDVSSTGRTLGKLNYETRTALITRRHELITAAKTQIAGGFADDFPIEIRSLQGASEQRVLKGHSQPIHTLALSAEHRWLASGGDDFTVRAWPLESSDPPVVLKGHTEAVTAVRFVGDERWLVSGAFDGCLLLWDLQSPDSLPLSLVGHTDEITAIRVSPNQQWLVTSSSDRTIRIWDLRWLRVIKQARDALGIGAPGRVKT